VGFFLSYWTVYDYAGNVRASFVTVLRMHFYVNFVITQLW